MKLERSSLRTAIHARVREKILAGELEPGAALSEPALAAELGVSRSPLREALLTLEFEGLLSSEIHRGFSVRALDERTIAEVYPLIGVLEGLAVRLGAGALRERVSELRELNERLRAGGGTPGEMAELDLAFHRGLVGAYASAELERTRDTLLGRVRIFDRPDERGVAAVERSCDQHDAILQAVEAGRPARAARLVEHHWESGVRIVVGWLRNRRS